MNFIGIIPARYASTRFPGKPLVKIDGRPMIQHVYEKACKALDTVYIATDDLRISDAAKNFGAQVVMTGDFHKSGTDRCAEALKVIKTNTQVPFDVVLNIQGDEPFMDISHIELLKNCFNALDTQIATLIRSIHENDDLFNPNLPKVIVNAVNEAIYFSRSPIPYYRNAEKNEWHTKHQYYKHIGIYAYRCDILEQITQLKISKLEEAESLEQLRWIENGYKIKTAHTEIENLPVDTPEDLVKIEKYLSR